VILAIVLLAGLYIWARQALTRLVRGRLLSVLGPGSHIGHLDVAWGRVVATNVHITAPPDWPATESLRIARVTLTPKMAALLSRRSHLDRVVIEQPYLPVLRSARNTLHVIPSLAGASPPAASPTLIDTLEVRGGTVELFDASVSGPAIKLRFEDVSVSAITLLLPRGGGRTPVEVQGRFKGVERDGRVSISGWIDGGDSSLTTVLDDIDLVAVQPYLIKASEMGVEGGALHLELSSRVQHKQLHGQGQMVLSQLRFTVQGFADTFIGVPQKAILAALKNGKDQIPIKFELRGAVDDPTFSISEDLATSAALGMAAAAELSVDGIAGRIEAMGEQGLDAVGKALLAVGSGVQRFLRSSQDALRIPPPNEKK
jgi:uncharacterized protein involved in outer membrane biogenesis